MNVTRPTGASWIYRPGSPSAPKDPLGWKPVQLAPENAKRGKGGFPLKVTAGKKQAVLIEIFTARDLPPGGYTGKITVNTDGKTTNKPVELRPVDFSFSPWKSQSAMGHFVSGPP